MPVRIRSAPDRSLIPGIESLARTGKESISCRNAFTKSLHSIKASVSVIISPRLAANSASSLSPAFSPIVPVSWPGLIHLSQHAWQPAPAIGEYKQAVLRLMWRPLRTPRLIEVHGFAWLIDQNAGLLQLVP